MRLLDIKRYINFAYENFDPKFSSGNSTYYLDNVLNLKKSIQALYDSEILVFSETEIDAYTLIVSSITDRFILDGNQHNTYKRELDKLKYTISVLHSWINRYVTTEETEDIINIKLPIIQSLDLLTKSCSMVDKALTQSVSEFGGEIKFKQLDYGSSWITISAKTGAAADFIMGLTKVAYGVAKKYYNIKLMQKEYELQGMVNEMITTIQKFNEKIKNDEINKKAEEIEKQYYKDKSSDPERIGRLRNSINELVKLIELGGEIHPSALLEKSKENQIDYKSISAIIPQGLLTDNKSEDTNIDDEK